MLGKSDIFRDLIRVKDEGIPHSVDALPDYMPREIVVGQVTVDAFHPSMSALVKPRFIL